jgi:hypothetical protein
VGGQLSASRYSRIGVVERGRYAEQEESVEPIRLCQTNATQAVSGVRQTLKVMDEGDFGHLAIGAAFMGVPAACETSSAGKQARESGGEETFHDGVVFLSAA